MVRRWIVALSISSALAAFQPAYAQSPSAKDATPAPSAAAKPPSKDAAPTTPQASGDPNVSYPLTNGGTYQGPLTGQGDPAEPFYKGYNRT